jgi:ADP-heptose:LPS heptosyltransferase
VSGPRRILVSRVRRIGDVILTLPVVDALRAAYPEAEIDYLAESGPAQAVAGHPAVRRVLSFRPWPGLPAPPATLAALVTGRYDLTIDLYGNPRSAILTALTGAPMRIGPARRGRRHLYTHPVPEPKGTLSAIRHHLRSLEVLGHPTPAPARPRIHLDEAERAEGRSVLDATLPPGSPRVGLHVGNRWPSKRWPETRFRALARELSRMGARPVLLTGPGEEEIARRVGEQGDSGRPGPPVLAGLPLRTYWSVLAALDAFVTNDGSPLHAGPAVGVPTIGILGPTVPEIWFPYDATDGHQVLAADIWCRPCHRHECERMDCLHWIGVAAARRAVERALARSGDARGIA